MRGLFLGHSLVIVKWTWGFFPQNLQFDPPCPPIQLSAKEYSASSKNLVIFVLTNCYNNFGFEKNASRRKLSRFLKMRGLFLGHSLVIVKWTWGFFPQNLQFDPPCPPIQLSAKEYSASSKNLVIFVLTNCYNNFGFEKNASRRKLSRFLKMRGLFLGHSLVIIKWTWGFLSQNM